MQEPIDKKYYTIGQVASIIGESASLIRFWEKGFTILKPNKTEKGTRKYTQQDIELLKLIHHLVKQKGMTLQGTQQYLTQQKATIETDAEILSKLKQLKSFLITIKNHLDVVKEP
jgi:DNA-binding transcriptional MerR regulator